VRIAELSRETGVPVPTIKYYVREGLLPPGELTSPNQAQYDESHVRRLKLVRALVEVGGLSIAATRDVLSSIEAPEKSLHETFGKVQYALTARREPSVDDEAWEAAAREVDDLISRRGWIVSPANPARQTLTELLATLKALRHEFPEDLLDEFAASSESIAATQLKSVLSRGDVEGMLEKVVIGNVLGDAILSALRRLAQENESARVAQDQAAAET
jgi:DNA-binding transcriptional MerR regulator